MPHIATRDEDNNTRKKRLAQLGRGPGVFVYDGSLHDTISHPMPLLTGEKEVVLDEKGFPEADRFGRVKYKPAGRPVVDSAGRAVMGGQPRIERVTRDVVSLRGVDFPKDTPVEVDDASLALKLRGMPGFAELDADEAEDHPVELSRPAAERVALRGNKPSPGRRRRYKRRVKADAEDEPAIEAVQEDAGGEE